MRWAYLFHRNCTPNLSKDESHGLHISTVRQKTGPGIPSELCSGDSSCFSGICTPMTSFQMPLKMYGAHVLTYFLKFPNHPGCTATNTHSTQPLTNSYKISSYTSVFKSGCSFSFPFFISFLILKFSFGATPTPVYYAWEIKELCHQLKANPE